MEECSKWETSRARHVTTSHDISHTPVQLTWDYSLWATCNVPSFITKCSRVQGVGNPQCDEARITCHCDWPKSACDSWSPHAYTAYTRPSLWAPRTSSTAKPSCWNCLMIRGSVCRLCREYSAVSSHKSTYKSDASSEDLVLKAFVPIAMCSAF